MKWVKFFVWCRFNGEDFLNKWKGKKIMFVGDSLSLNMWESLSCMIHASVPNATTSFSRKETISTVIFQVIVVLLCLSLVFQMLLLMIHFFFMNIIFHVCLSSIFILLCLFLYYMYLFFRGFIPFYSSCDYDTQENRVNVWWLNFHISKMNRYNIWSSNK
jgi:hypothetical protein